MLGYNRFTPSASTAFRRAEFGEGSGLVYLEGLQCEGDEDYLLDCATDVELGLSTCDHSRDASIRCFGRFVFRFYASILVPLSRYRSVFC